MNQPPPVQKEEDLQTGSKALESPTLQAASTLPDRDIRSGSSSQDIMLKEGREHPERGQ